MGSIIVIGIIAIAAIAFLLFRRGETKVAEVAVPSYKPNTINDKVILVAGWNEDEVKTIIADFMKEYKDGGYALYKIDYRMEKDNQYRLTFPQDIHPLLFTFFVNYLAYPFNFDLKTHSITVIGKTTLDATFEGIDGGLVGKTAVLYLPENDQDYDVVYLQTEKGISYSNSFTELKWKKIRDARLSAETKSLITELESTNH